MQSSPVHEPPELSDGVRANGVATHEIPPWSGVARGAKEYVSSPTLWFSTFEQGARNGEGGDALALPLQPMAGVQLSELSLLVQSLCGAGA